MKRFFNWLADHPWVATIDVVGGILVAGLIYGSVTNHWVIALASLVIAFPVADLLATIFLATLWLIASREYGGSWLLALLVITSGIVTASYIILAILTLRRLFGLQPLPEGVIYTSGVLIALGTVPIIKAVVFAVHRRRSNVPLRSTRRTAKEEKTDRR